MMSENENNNKIWICFNKNSLISGYTQQNVPDIAGRSIISLKPGQLITGHQLKKLRQNSILSTDIGHSSDQQHVSHMQTLSPQTPGQSNVTGNAVNIEETVMSNGSWIMVVVFRM